MKNDINLKTLAEQFMVAKKVEEEAIAERRRIGKLLEEAIPGPDEGTANESIDNIKISVTRKVTRKIDADRLSLLWGEISKNTQEAFRWTAALNTKHYRALQELGTEELAEANQFITTTPAATSVEVTIKE